jgi:hypothetical protein
LLSKGATKPHPYASNESDAWVLAFKLCKTEPIWEIFTQIGPYHRLPYSVPGGNIKVVKPTRSLEEIRTEALAASPPEEKGPYRNSDLVELAKLDRAIHLDIRYATANDFLGKAVYTQARAFLQRPAAEALVRALHRLQPYGYGVLIRRLSPLVCHENFLGCDSREWKNLCSRPRARLAPQPRLRRGSYAV